MKTAALSEAKNAAGARFSAGLEYTGSVIELARRTAVAAIKPPYAFGELIRQIESIGVRSLPIVILTAIFSSLVMTVQMGVQLQRFGALEYVGNVVSMSLVRELGPVLTALLVGGRVGAGIAAEIGSMAVTEQVDAIRSMGADPVKKLVVPRVLAAVISLPLLTVLANTLGVLASAVIAGLEYGIGMRYFLTSVGRSVGLDDFLGGVGKTIVFGGCLALIACHEGLLTRGGTAGVGLSTTRTVVISSVITLISDFLMTTILISLGY
jgi:phospholipid/cholesterol/gamma-HCH transport system permease protein